MIVMQPVLWPPKVLPAYQSRITDFVAVLISVSGRREAMTVAFAVGGAHRTWTSLWR